MSDFPTKLFIDGELRDSRARSTIPQINPATEEKFTDVSAASPQDLDTAINELTSLADKIENSRRK